ncbi:MAG: acyltransferase [Rhizobiales bacterium]|nr:acyltransferase [Hyphomicrobiales bacterium]
MKPGSGALGGARIAFFDEMRALAIIPVVIHHYYSPWLIGGGVGVGVFFGLSGFLIGSLLLDLKEFNIREATKFIFRRFMRIYPTYLFTAVAAIILSDMAGNLERKSDIIAALPSILTFTEMPKWLGFGIGVMWTLHVEFWFYVTLPIAMLIFGRERAIIIFAIMLLGLGVLSYFRADLGQFLPLRYGMALAPGTLVALAWKKNWLQHVKFGSLGWLLVTAVAAVVYLWTLEHKPFSHWMFQVMAASLCACAMIIAFLNDDRLQILPFSWWIGRISYSMYLMHGLVIDYGITTLPISPFLPNYGRASLLFALVLIVVSTLSFLLIETPGIWIGRKLSALWWGKSQPRKPDQVAAQQPSNGPSVSGDNGDRARNSV